MRKHILAAVLAIAAAPAFADAYSDSVITAYQNAGYTVREVEVGPSIVKVEAYSGGNRYEIYIDRSTGQEISREVRAMRESDQDDLGRSPEVYTSATDDSVGHDMFDDHGGDRDDDRDDDDDDGHHSSGHDDDDDDHDDDHGGRGGDDDDEDDDDDDHGGRGHDDDDDDGDDD